MTGELVGRRVIYHGRVQGVGFRFTTRSIAAAFEVTGFVRNCSDGTVELVVQGHLAEVSRFLAEVSNRLSGNISRSEETEVTPDSQRSRFEIRR